MFLNLRRLIALMSAHVGAPRVFPCLMMTGNVSAAAAAFAFTFFGFVFGGS